MDIAEVARRSGVPAYTLRYYEERGLISSIGRRGLRRDFEPAVLKRLALIVTARSAGFSISEIGVLIGQDGRPKLDREKLAAKADELDTTIDRLTTLRDELRRAATCPASSHLECPNFLRRLDEVSTESKKRRQAKVPGPQAVRDARRSGREFGR